MVSPCYTSRAFRVYVRPRADRMELSPTASAWQPIKYCVGHPLSLFPHLTLIEYTTVTAAPSRSPATHTNLHPRHAVYIPCLQQYKSTYVPCRTLFPCARTGLPKPVHPAHLREPALHPNSHAPQRRQAPCWPCRRYGHTTAYKTIQNIPTKTIPTACIHQHPQPA